jgi:uncharacterized protein (TIRG00374 family)
MRRTIFIIASVLVSVLFLWLALRDVQFDEVVKSVRQADVGWLLLSMLIGVGGLWSRGVRWRGLLGFKIPLVKAFHIWNITSLVNQLPLRAGEVARSLLAVREGVPFVTAATSIVVERLLDTLFVVVLLTYSLSRSPSAPQLAVNSVMLFGVGSVVGFATLVFFARYPNIARSLLSWFEARIALLQRLPLHRLLDQLIDGLQPLTHWRSAAHAVFWTLISWAFSWATFYALHKAMRVEGVNLALSTSLSLSLASFSIAIPVSIAGLGPFQAAVRVAGEAAVLPPVSEAMKATYAALGFLIHGMNTLNYAIWGTIGMLALGVSWSDVVKREPSLKTESTTP